MSVAGETGKRRMGPEEVDSRQLKLKGKKRPRREVGRGKDIDEVPVSGSWLTE